MRLGVELLDGSAVAVSVDEDGHVIGRGAAGPLPDPGAAAVAALDAVAGLPSTSIAIASVSPESPATLAATRALAQRFAGRSIHAAVASGTAAAVAESWIGAAPEARNVVFFAAAEQTTGGILRDGLPMTGAHNRAPAIAWLALNPVEREDYRKIGCLEAEVGAPGIVRRLVWRIKSGDHSRVAEAAGDLKSISVDQILAAARSGDGVAISVMRDTAKYLGMAAANLVAVADPDVLILGGLIASASDLLLDAVRVEVARRLPPVMMQSLKIVTASLGADAPAIGAARLAAVAPP